MTSRNIRYDGLVGTVRLSGSGTVTVHFRYGLRRNGKRGWYYCGTWPATPLEAIRRARDDAQADTRAGINPSDKRIAVKLENQRKVELALRADAERMVENATFGTLFEQWLRDGVARKDGNAEIRRSFDRDVLPLLGEKPVRLVSEHDLRSVLRLMVGRGVNRMAVIVFRDLRQVYAWAEKRQPWRRLLLEGNPANLIDIERIVAPDYDLSNVRDRVLDPDEIRDLQRIFTCSQAEYDAASDQRSAVRPVQTETQIAIWLCLSTCCRIGELLMAQWEHVDLDAETWFVPKENVKGVRGKKQDHLVFLSKFAADKFRSLRAVTGHTSWCFPSRDGKHHVSVKTVSKQVGDRQQRFKSRKELEHRERPVVPS